MKRDLGVKPFLYPMPVLMIGTYNEDGSVDVMNMAWGGVCAPNMVALNISKPHRTTENIKRTQAFTLAVADAAHVAEADWFGIASGNDTPDKFARTGMHAVKSTRVDAPVIEEFPVTLECKVHSIETVGGEEHVVGEILNVIADESVMDGDKVDPKKVNAFIFDQFQHGYYAIGEKIGQAWETGEKFN